MITNSIAPDALGGLDRYARELSAALVRHGLAVDVVTKRSDPTSPGHEVGSDGVSIHRFDLPSRQSAAYGAAYALTPWRAVRRHLRANPDAAVHGHFAVQTLPVAVMGRPFVYSFQSPANKEVLAERSFRLAKPLRRTAQVTVRSIERQVVAKAHRNITLSEFMRGELELLSPRAAQRAVVLPGAVDLQRFTPGPALEHPWTAAPGPLLFTARRFVPRTGVMELVLAMPAVLQQIPEARLAVAGAGPLELELRDLIGRLRLEASVQLLGRIPDDELVGWYRAADLVVMPTQELEGFGLTTAEAMACGTPVVGTPAGSVPEVVSRLDADLVARSPSSEHIAEKIIQVASRPGYLTALARRARGSVDPLLGWDVTAQRFMELYEELPRFR